MFLKKTSKRNEMHTRLIGGLKKEKSSKPFDKQFVVVT